MPFPHFRFRIQSPLSKPSAFLRFFAAACVAASGPLSGSASAQEPAVVGRWGALIKAEFVPIHVVLLPNGKIMYWDRHDQGIHDMIPRVWDPATNITFKTPSPGYDMF